jgi:hypothetical protein
LKYADSKALQTLIFNNITFSGSCVIKEANLIEILGTIQGQNFLMEDITIKNSQLGVDSSESTGKSVISLGGEYATSL